VVRNAVNVAECNAAAAAIWAFLEADPRDTASWYKQHTARNGLMVVFTRHPALQAIRNSPVIRRAYEQLYGSKAIYKVVDKVSFNPPETSYYSFAGSPLHWDTSLTLPVPFRLQGLLYLSEVTAKGGAFSCVPGFHRSIDDWLKHLPPDVDAREYALRTLQPQPVPGDAGDFIIWHQALPHCASPNRGHTPRLVQYLTYLPEGFEDHRAWK
jgi:ectoine hydroxylase-related dioxygenase (phytanoyl-CoA dioxygenase family)